MYIKWLLMVLVLFFPLISEGKYSKTFYQFECNPKQDYMALNIIRTQTQEEYDNVSKQPNTWNMCSGKRSADNKYIEEMGIARLSCKLSDDVYEMYAEFSPGYGYYPCGLNRFEVVKRGVALGSTVGDDRFWINTLLKNSFDRIEIPAQPLPEPYAFIKGRFYLSKGAPLKEQPGFKNKSWGYYALGRAKEVDCAKPYTYLEQVVCGDSELRKMDDIVKDIHKEFYSRKDMLKEEQDFYKSYKQPRPSFKENFYLRLERNAKNIDELYDRYSFEIMIRNNYLNERRYASPSDNISKLPDRSGEWPEEYKEPFENMRKKYYSRGYESGNQRLVDLTEKLITYKVGYLKPIRRVPIPDERFMKLMGKCGISLYDLKDDSGFPIQVTSPVSLYKADVLPWLKGDEYILELTGGFEARFGLNYQIITYLLLNENTCVVNKKPGIVYQDGKEVKDFWSKNLPAGDVIMYRALVSVYDGKVQPYGILNNDGEIVFFKLNKYFIYYKKFFGVANSVSIRMDK